jgi:hypothetical protein
MKYLKLNLFLIIVTLLIIVFYPDLLNSDKTGTKFVSKKAAVMETVGEAEVKVEYDRLLTEAEERMFGSEIPYGKAWSPGDEAAVILSVSKPVIIHGETLKAGSYNLYMIPEMISEENKAGASKNWDLIFTQVAKKERRDFNLKEEILRVKTRAQLEDNSKQQMEFFFEERKDEGRILRFLFEYVEVHIPIDEANYQSSEIPRAMVMNSIDTTEIKVVYNRADAKNGGVFGIVIPFGKPWGASHGSDASIEFSKDLLFQNQPISAGKYFIEIIPKENEEWLLSLYQNINDKKSVAYQETIHVEIAESGPQWLEYYFDYVSDSERNLVLAWDRATLVFNLKKLNI